MGDLTDKESAQSTKLVGTSSDATETYAVGASANAELFGCDRLNNGGTAILKTVTTTPEEVMVGGAVKTERKCVLLQAFGKIKFGFSNSVLVFELYNKQYAALELGPNTALWVKAVSGTVDVAIAEVS
jgi:hypothetical protein